MKTTFTFHVGDDFTEDGRQLISLIDDDIPKGKNNKKKLKK